MADEEIKVALTANVSDYSASIEAATAATKAHTASLDQLDAVMRGGTAVSMTEYMEAARNSTAATIENTAAVAENAAAQAGLNETIKSGAAVREYSALVDEAIRGRYSQMTGTVAVLSNRLGLMSALFSPLGAAVLGAAGAVGVLVAAFVKGEEESANFEKALLASGGAIGITEDDYRSMAAEIATGNTTLGQAKDALSAVIEAGKFSGDQILQVAAAVAAGTKLTGESAKEMVKAFEGLGDKPAEAAAKLNEQFNFLTPEIYQQITAMEKFGDTSGAAALAIQTFSDAMVARNKEMEQSTGTLGKMWELLRSDISSAWAEAQKMGTTDTIGDQIAALQKDRDFWGQYAGQSQVAADRVRALEKEIVTLQIKQQAEEANAHATADSAAATRDYIEAQKEADKAAPRITKPKVPTAISNEALNQQIENNGKLVKNEQDTVETIGQIDDEMALAGVESKRQALQASLAVGNISRQEELQGEMELENQKYAIQQAILEQNKTLYAQDTKEYDEQLKRQEQLALQHQQRMGQINQAMLQDNISQWHAYLAPVSSGIASAIDGMINHTETWRQAEHKIAEGVLNDFINIQVRKAAEYAAEQLGETQTAQMAGTQQTVIAQESASTQQAASLQAADTSISANAATAASGAAASVASIPYVGWAEALEVGGAVLAGVLAYKSIASAEGGWEDVPGNSLTMLHPHEMVLPAETAQTVRDAVGGGGRRGGGVTNHYHVNAIDTRSLAETFRRNPKVLTGAMAKAGKLGIIG